MYNCAIQNEAPTLLVQPGARVPIEVATVPDYNPPNSKGQFKVCKSGKDCVHPDGPRLPATTIHFFKLQKGYSARCKKCMNAISKTQREKQRKSTNGYIYFIQSVEGLYIKIGFTMKNVDRRLRQLQGACPTDLCLIGYLRGTSIEEQNLHKRFQEFNKHGEWFKLSKELIEYIEQSALITRVNLVATKHPGARRQPKKRQRASALSESNQLHLPLIYDD